MSYLTNKTIRAKHREISEILSVIISSLAFVILVSGCVNDRIKGGEEKNVQNETAPNTIIKSYSAFEGNYARLIAKVTDNKDSLYVELFGHKYQKVDLIPINGEPNGYQVSNGRIVFGMSEDSQQIGLFHYGNKNSSRKVFAPKITTSETNPGIQGDYIYQGCIITEENNRLYTLRASGDKLEKRELFSISPTEFFVYGTGETIEFVMGTDGEASKIINNNSGGSTTMHRAQYVVNNQSKIGPKRFNGGWAGGGDLAMYWSHDPTVVNESITRCIISIHGGSRNAVGSYEYVQDLSISLGENNTTMVLAPHFCESDDGQPASVLHWTGEEDGDWRKGDNSANFGHVSNYEILDKLIESVVNKCPNLLNIIVAGHSAGGQVVTRYSSGTQIPEKLNLNTSGNPFIRYIVSNPSSYMYYSNERWSGGTWPVGNFSPVASDCSSAAPSHYEAIHLNDYMSRNGLDLRTNLQKRNVLYLLGELDIENDPGLDKSCLAMLQGENRLERGFIYLAHLRDEFGENNVLGHSISIVPGVGHNTWLMYKSYNGLKALFDYEHSYL